MRRLFFIIGCGLYLCVSAQKDTIVVTDYTKVMVSTDDDGLLTPVTSLEDVTQAGFFINEISKGTIRICASDELFIWINGKLLDAINDCQLYEPADILSKVEGDTIYFSFSSKKSLADLTCDLVIFEELLVIKDQISVPRDVRSKFNEFTIIALFLLLIILGIIISEYPSRMAYLAEKSFTLKASAYEFVNTSFYSGASMYILCFYSLALAFVGIYLDTLLGYGLFAITDELAEFMVNWLKIGSIIFLLFIAKWLVISIVSGLFRFRDLNNFQLFDFLNFNLVLLIPALLFLVLDFVLNDSSQTWISSGFMLLFPIMLILFVAWFTLKFLNNSSRKKLSIISYLCATEIIPVIILLGWFFK